MSSKLKKYPKATTLASNKTAKPNVTMGIILRETIPLVNYVLTGEQPCRQGPQYANFLPLMTRWHGLLWVRPSVSHTGRPGWALQFTVLTGTHN